METSWKRIGAMERRKIAMGRRNRRMAMVERGRVGGGMVGGIMVRSACWRL